MKCKLNRAGAAILALAVAASLCVTALAHDVPDMTREGSVTLSLHIGEEPVSGGTLTLHRVGEVHEDDGNYSFRLTEAFAPSGASLENLQSPELAQTLAQYAANKTGLESQAVGDDGTVTFEGLELGLYLIVQEKAAPGYEKISPVLVSVPYMKDGVYLYDVDASPKPALRVEPTPTPPPPPTKPTEPTLPQTGQLNWPVPLLAVTGMALFAAGLLLSRRGKHNG